MKERIENVDYVKGIMIFLMVMFHINYIESIQPVTGIVYAFHMPVFLFYSGYFLSVSKPLKTRLYNIFRSLIIPYIIFEVLYLLMLYFAGALGFNFSNKIDNFSLSLLLYRIFVCPIGAYWYLHTIIICMLAVYIVDRFIKDTMTAVITTGILFFVLSLTVEGIKFENTLFFILGYYFKRNNISIPSGLISLVAAVIIAYLTFSTIERGSTASIGLTILIISFLYALYDLTKRYQITNIFTYLGRNTLIIVLIHPIFLNLFKLSLKWFQVIDSSGLVYVFINTIFTIAVSILISFIMDKLNISKLFFGKKIYVPLETFSGKDARIINNNLN